MFSSTDNPPKEMSFPKCSYQTNGDEMSLKRGKLLYILAVFFLLQGLCFLTASFFDHSLKVLPKDPLSMIGIVSMESGAVMLIVGTICKMWSCGGRSQLENSKGESTEKAESLLSEKNIDTQNEEKQGEETKPENKKDQ